MHYHSSSHGSFSNSGCTFFKSNRHHSSISGSSGYEVDYEDCINKKVKGSKKKWRPKIERKIDAYTVNKSLVTNKALQFLNLPSARQFTAFYSISFPLGFPDKSAIKCLNTWLTRLRSMKKRFNYLWIAERQKNGTIHFHLLTTSFFNIKVVNHFMSVAIRNVIKTDGLEGMEYNKSKYNGVDVKRVFSAKGAVKYLVKYIGKGSDGFECRANGFSRLVSALFTRLIVRANEAIGYWCHFRRDNDENPFDYGRSLNDFCYWVPWRHGPPSIYVKKLSEINRRLSESFDW